MIIKQPAHNPRKVYLISRTPCRHYYINQSIDGVVFYRRWERTTSKYIKDIFNLTYKDFK